MWKIVLVVAFLWANRFANAALEMSMRSATKVEGDELLVSCRDGSGQPTHWTGPEGKNLGPKSHPQLGKASYGTWLLFERVRRTDTGVYTCSSPFAQDTFTLNVEGPYRPQGRPPQRTRTPDSREYVPFHDKYGGRSVGEELVFRDTPPRQKTGEHTNFTIRCEATGKNTVISWFRTDGRQLIPSKFQNLADGLLVLDASKEDSGTYVCRAAQLATGIVKEQKIQFNVEHKPYPVHDKEVNVFGYIGSQLNLTCHVFSNPEPEFSWYKKYHKAKRPIENEVYSDHNTSILYVYFADDSVMGTYVCQAKNDLGMTEIIFEVDKGEQPKTPKYLELKGRNHDFLDLGVIHSDEEYSFPGMEPTNYIFKFRHIEEPDWHEMEFQVSEKNSYILDNLERSSDYEVKVAARNVAGVSDFTKNVSYFTTLSEPSHSYRHLSSLPLIITITFMFFSVFFTN